MHFSLNKLGLACAAAGLLSLSGCGGGGGGSSTGSGPTISGTAATGAAFTDATVTVKDGHGTTVGTASVRTDGSYSVTLSAGATAPFVINATRTNADGVTETLVSLLPTASSTSATVNITPVSTLIAARLSASGDPTKLADEVSAGTTTLDSTTVNAKVQEVKQILAPILTATGTTSVDPLGDTFSANGAGYDRLLDSIKVTITPSSTTASNIEIGIKQQQSEGSAPVVIQFDSTQSASTISTNNSITSSSIGGTTVGSSNLLPSGTSALIASLLAQLNTCYALPVGSRVNSVVTNGVATGDQSNVSATECRNAFIQSGGVISYKHNSATLGRDSNGNGAFNGLFNDSSTGLVFSQGTYEFTRGNGDIVASYKAKDAAGNETYDAFVLHLDSDNKLKLIGNQYNYPGGVSAYHQLRKFPTLSQGAWDYYSTGYALKVDHVTGGTGTDGSIFNRVEVTTPTGRVLTLKPKAGMSYLPLVKNPGGSETITGTNFVRLNSVYVDSGNATDPAIKDTSLFFADRTLYPDTTIATIPAQSVWKFDYFLAGNTGTTPDATQHYKTRARALTTSELQTRGFAALTSNDLSWANSQAIAYNGSNSSVAGKIPFSGQSAATLDWTIGSNALPPTSIQIWGSFNDGTHSGSFNDSSKVRSTARTGNISCSASGASDYHCASGAYTTTTYLNGAHLWARDTNGREFASYFAFYRLP